MHHGGRRAPFRLADQEVNVIGHHHVSDHYEAVPLPDVLQNLQEQIAPPRAAQPWLPMITTACEKMQVPVAVIALEAFGHAFTVRAARPPRARKKKSKSQGVRNWECPPFANNAKDGPPAARAGLQSLAVAGAATVGTALGSAFNCR